LKEKIQRKRKVKKVPEILKKRKITETSKEKALEAGMITQKVIEVAGLTKKRVQEVAGIQMKVKSMII